MMTFEGQAKRLVDEKNRIVWPKEWQDEVSSGIYVFRWPDRRGKYLMAVPALGWEIWKEENLSKNKYDANARIIHGFVNGLLRHIIPGTNGRVLFPKELMDYAGVKSGKDIYIIRTDGEYRLYAEDQFEKVIPSLDEALEAMDNLDISR